MSGSMRRGKNQVLFRFLPGKPIDFEQGNAIALVERWFSSSVSKDVNKSRILREVWRAKQAFGTNTRGYPRVLDESQFELLSPVFIEAELFPLTFVCDQCSKAYTFSTVQQFNRTLRRHRCSCGNPLPLKQLDLIYYHKCGSLWAPKIPRCKTHGFELIKLNRHNSNSPKYWRWDCGICNVEITNLNNWCPACLGGDSQVYPNPFRQSSVFTPQSLSIVNFSRQAHEHRISDDKVYQMITLADYLGLLQKHGITFEDALNMATTGGSEHEERIAELKSKYPADIVNDILKQMGIDPEGRKKTDEITSEVTELMDPPEGNILPLVLTAYDFIRTKKESTLIPLEDIVRNAEQTGSPNVEKVRTFPSFLKSIGVKDAYLLGNLSIANVVYGFTRGKLDEKDKILNVFPSDKSTKQGVIPIYMNTNETEAILLEFDRTKLINWLKANGHEINVPRTNEAERAWFLNHIRQDLITPFKPIVQGSEEDQATRPFTTLNTELGLTRDVYRLLHTISHTLLSTAATECGLDRNSLAEIILPQIPAVIIYCSSLQQAQTGGMFTLFENNVIPWISRARDKVDTCIYDPVCMEHQSSCHACVQLSEISCEHFNHDLGRDILIGKESNSRKITGFWRMQDDTT